MKWHIKKAYPDASRWQYRILELALVFLPAFLLIKVMSPWVGDNAVRNLAVIWVANILILVMVWTAHSVRGASWKDLGLTFNRFSRAEAFRTFGLSMLVFVIGIAAYLLAPVLIAAFVEFPQSADFSRYDFLKDNPGALFLSLIAVYIVSSFGEEVIYRAFLINRISDLFRNTKHATPLAVILSAVFFGAIHYEWGFMGIIQTGFMGLAMGVCYLWLKKRLWVLVLAHAYMDTILLVQLYLANN